MSPPIGKIHRGGYFSTRFHLRVVCARVYHHSKHHGRWELHLTRQIQTSPTVNPIFSGTIFTDKDGSVSRNSTTISDKVFSDITQVLIAAESSKGYDIHNGIIRHISILVWTTLKGPETLRLSDS